MANTVKSSGEESTKPKQLPSMPIKYNNSIEALRLLVNWVPEGSFPLEQGVYGEDPRGDLHYIPFCCEAYTYALWGKDDARSFLALIGGLARALGLEGWRDLRGAVHR